MEKIEGNKDGVWFLGMLPFEKHNFISVSPFPYFRTANLGKNIDANFSGENCGVISTFRSPG